MTTFFEWEGQMLEGGDKLTCKEFQDVAYEKQVCNIWCPLKWALSPTCCLYSQDADNHKGPISCLQNDSDSQNDKIKRLLRVGEIIGLNETY